MTKNVFSTPIAHAQLQRNAFDLSRRDVFSCKVGQLLPVLSLEVNPNEHFEIRPDIFLRTQTLNTCAYARMKQNIEFFFVPYRSLWFKSDQFFTGTNYSTSSVYSSTPPLYIPRFPLSPDDASLPNNTLLQYLLDNLGTELDEFGQDRLLDTIRLLDMLGYGNYSAFANMQKGKYDASKKTNVRNYASLLRLCAYQKIYQDHYRLSLYEPYDNGCSLDDLQKAYEKNNTGIVFDIFGSATSPIVVSSGIKRFFSLRYAPWKKDYFTNLRSSSSLYLSSWMYPSNDLSGLHNTGNLYNDGDNTFGVYNSLGAAVNLASQGQIPDGPTISALDIRSVFALEKLLDNMSRAKDGSYGAQIEARFGVKPLLDPHLDSVYIGGTDGPVTIGEVTATASSSIGSDPDSVSSALGQVAGKGTSSSSDKTISFDAKEHGIIMGIFSIVPESEYNATGIDPMLSKFQRSEFFTPEFDKLGFTPVTMKEMFAQGSVTGLNSYMSDNVVLGFNPMYSEYKTAIDKVHGDFMSPSVNALGSLSSWVTPRLFEEIRNDTGLTYAFLHVNPAIADTIFAVTSSEADQFLVNCWMDIRAIRPMSVNGLPYCN